MNSKVTVLIVEHNPLVALDLTEMIEEMGITRIFTVANAIEARKVADKQYISIALLDVNLRGGEDGALLARHLTNRTNAKIIYLITDSRIAALKRVKETNPISILKKPFVDEDLTNALKLAMVFNSGGKSNSYLD
ncbi:MAG: response regulator [Cyclobacteriaceae bacterium]